ncbi:hypothetical protein SNE40_021308 [Patella caerulea]|uniref:S1 motif domain-containing protein n=1 Tax=Patella caerulea TaxID=87958 RepID=A0AAN8IWH9_PATCE
MDSYLLSKTLRQHGAPLLRWLEAEQREALPQAIIQRAVLQEFGAAQMLELGDGNFQVRLNQFIARKADMLFKEKESDTEKEIQKLSNEDTYAIMPPMEFFMGISYLNLRKHFFNSVQKNDVLIGVVNDVMEGGLLINLLCTDNQKVRDLDGLNIAVFCPAKELPQIHQHFNPTENFQVKDVIRGVVVVVNPENEKIIISLHTRHLEGKSDIFLGLITEEEFPVHYRRRLQVKGLSFDELLKSILGFNNSGNAQFLQKHHSLDDQESLMRGLHGLKIPEPEYAENVRKLQSARKAHQSVLQGVTLFKKGNYLEAMQYLNRALQIDDKNVEGLVARGALYANNECYSRAIEDFDEALKDNPQHTNAMMYLIETLLAQGKVQSDKKDWDSAEETYERVLKLRPNHPEAVDALKVVYIKKEPPPIIKASPKSGAKKPSNDLFDHFIDLIEERKPRQMTPSGSSRRRRSRSQSPTSRRSSYNRKRSKSPQSRYGHSRGRRRSRSSDRRKSRHDSKSPKKERDNSESPSKMTKEKVKSPRAKISDKKKSKRKSQSPKSRAHDQHKSKDNDESTRVKGSDTRQSRKHRDLTDSKVSDNQPNSTSPSTKLVKLKSEPNVNKEIITEQKGKEHYTPERSPVLTAREQTPELRSPERKKTRVMSPDKQPNSSSPDWGEKSKTPSQLLRPGSHGRSSSFDEDEYLYGDSSIGYEKDLPTFKNDKEDKYIKTKRLSSPQERRSHDLDDRAEIRKTEKNQKCKDDWKDDVINKDCDGNRRKYFYKDEKKRRSYSHSPENSSQRHRRSSSSDSNTDAKEPYLAKKKKRFNRWDKSPEFESKSQDRSSVTKPHLKDQMRGSHFSDAAEKEIDQPVPQDYRIQDDASVFHPNMSAEKKGSFTGTITRTIFRSTFQPVVHEAQTEPPKTKPGFFLPRQIVISKKVDERTPNPDLEAGLNDERRSDSNDSHSRSRSPSYSRTDDRHTGHSDIRKKSDDNRKRRDHSSKRKSRSRTRDQSIEERIRRISPIIHRSRERLNYDKDVYANRSRHHSRSSSRESGQGGSSRSSSRDRTTNRKIKRSFSRDRKVNVAGSILKDYRSDCKGGKDRSSLSPYREGISRDQSNRRGTSNDSWGSIRNEKHGRGINQDRIVSSREQVGYRSDSQNGERCRRLNPDQKSDRSISHEREDSKYHRSFNRRESSSPDRRQEDSRSWKSPIHRRKYSKSPKRSRQDSESPKNTRKESRSPNRQDSRSPNCSRNSHRSKSLDRVSAVEGENDQKSRSFRISTSKSSERIRDVICSADRHGRNIRQDSKRGEKGARAMGPRQSIGIGYRTYTSKSPSPVRSSNLSKTRSSRSHSRNRSERKRSCSQSRNRLDKSNKPSSRRRSQSRNRSDRSRKPSSRSRSHSRSRKPSSRSRSHSRNRLDRDRKSPSYSRGRSRNRSDKDTKSFLRSHSRSRNHSDKGRKPSSHSRSRSRNRSDEIRKPSSRSNSPSKNQSDKNRKGWRPSRSGSRSLRGSKRPHSRSRSRSYSDRGSKRSHSRSRSRSQSNRNRIRSRCNSKSKIEKTSKSNDNSKRRFTESSNKIAGKPDLPDVISSHKDKKTPTKEKIQKGIKSEDELDKKIIQKRKRMSSSSSSSSSRSSSSSSSSGRRKTHKKPAALKIPLVKSKWDSSPKSSRWDPPDPKPRPPVNIPNYNQKPNKTLTQLETFLLELKQNKKKQTEQTTPPAKDKK